MKHLLSIDSEVLTTNYRHEATQLLSKLQLELNRVLEEQGCLKYQQLLTPLNVMIEKGNMPLRLSWFRLGTTELVACDAAGCIYDKTGTDPVDQLLYKLKKNMRNISIKSIQKMMQQHIQKVRDEHEQLRRFSSIDFLNSAKSQVAFQLRAKMIAANFPQHVITDVEQIAELNMNDVDTREKALFMHRKVKRLERHISEMTVDNDIKHLNTELALLTKRWIDPFYQAPLVRSQYDKIRDQILVISSNIGSIAAVSAFALFFIPGMQPVSLVMSMISLISMLPVLNTARDALSNLWYGRAITTDQAKKLGIGAVMLASAVGVGLGIISIASKISHQIKMVSIKESFDMGDVFIHGFYCVERAVKNLFVAVSNCVSQATIKSDIVTFKANEDFRQSIMFLPWAKSENIARDQVVQL